MSTDSDFDRRSEEIDETQMTREEI